MFILWLIDRKKIKNCWYVIFYIIFYLIGGTVDFSVVEIIEKYILKYFYYVSGGEWGGKNVNKEIFDIFESIFGVKVMKKFSDMKVEIL